MALGPCLGAGLVAGTGLGKVLQLGLGLRCGLDTDGEASNENKSKLPL